MRRTTSWITALVVCGMMAPAIQGQESEAETADVLVLEQAGQIQQNEERARTEVERANAQYELARARFALADAELASQGTSKYWIGIGIEDASESLRSQLGFEDRGAIIVTMVAENSPGKEAGLKVHDVLTHIKAGEEEKDLKEVADLTGLVTKTEKTPLELTVIRQGKSQRVTVTPVERPQPQDHLVLKVLTAPPTPAAGNSERVAELLKELNALIGQQSKPLSVHFTGPVVTPPAVNSIPAPAVAVPPPGVPHIVVMSKPELPENVTITITKTGKEPARVEYKQGEGKVWGAKESELNTLPPEGRQALVGVTRGLLILSDPHAAQPNVMFDGKRIVRSEWPVPFVYQLKEPMLTPATKSVTAPVPARVTTTKPNPTADRMSQLEKQMEVLQKQQQEVIHLLKRTMDKTEQK